MSGFEMNFAFSLALGLESDNSNNFANIQRKTSRTFIDNANRPLLERTCSS